VVGDTVYVGSRDGSLYAIREESTPTPTATPTETTTASGPGFSALAGAAGVAGALGLRALRDGDENQ
jgi:hypothetical protein